MDATPKKDGGAGWGNRLWEAATVRSGMLTLVVLAVVVLALAIGWREHMKGQFGRLKRELKRPEPALAPAVQQPGGQDPIVLERSTIEGGTVPEFLSETLLPGRGMNVLQIRAYLPGKGEVDLLASPSITETTTLLNGKDGDANGLASLALGGAFEIPWAGRIFGPAADGDSLSTLWEGQTIHLPVTLRNGVTASAGGLLLKMPSSLVKVNVMPDGGEAEATYDAGDFDGRWPSKLSITSTAQLSGRVLELKITARNTGDAPAPVGIGWQPHFRILNKNRSGMTLRLPSMTRIETRDHVGAPTGRLLPVENTQLDFGGRTGSSLGDLTIEDTFVHLRQAPLDNGPVAELRDIANNYGLRLTILSPSIKALHVSAPADKGYVTIAPRLNYDDPFGKEWPREEDTGMAILQPGQTAQWRVRLEIFTLTPRGI